MTLPQTAGKHLSTLNPTQRYLTSMIDRAERMEYLTAQASRQLYSNAEFKARCEIQTRLTEGLFSTLQVAVILLIDDMSAGRWADANLSDREPQIQLDRLGTLTPDKSVTEALKGLFDRRDEEHQGKTTGRTGEPPATLR